MAYGLCRASTFMAYVDGLRPWGDVINKHSLGDVINRYALGDAMNTYDLGDVINRYGLGDVINRYDLRDVINRYGLGDSIESWLHSLLCLDASSSVPTVSACPHPEQCELYYVERDTLFSYHKASEEFLQRIMALYVSSHYKNSPNDLQLLSDAPAHQLFVLVAPQTSAVTIPDVLCVVQVCLEGAISKQSMLNSLSRGKTAAGDLIPWTMSAQFQDSEFGQLSGVRIVRIATHPNLNRSPIAHL